MPPPEHISESVLQGEVLGPFIAAALCGVLLKTPERVRAALIAGGLLFAVGAGWLLGAMFWQYGPEIHLSWRDRGATGPTAGMAWGLNLLSVSIFVLLPWVHVTAALLARNADLTPASGAMRFVLLGGGMLTCAGRDPGSLLTGIVLFAGALACEIAWFGRDEKRDAARLWLGVQISGVLLLAGAFALLETSGIRLDLAEWGLEGTRAREMARTGIRTGRESLAVALLCLGGALGMAAFPFQGWMARVQPGAEIGQRLWIAVWPPIVLALLLRLSELLGLPDSGSLSMWPLTFALAGSAVAASLLFLAPTPVRFLSAGLLWSQQALLLAALRNGGQADTVLVGFVLIHLTIRCLWVLALEFLAADSSRFWTMPFSAEPMASERREQVPPLGGPLLHSLQGNPDGEKRRHARRRLAAVLMGAAPLLTVAGGFAGFDVLSEATTAIFFAPTLWGRTGAIVFLGGNLLALAAFLRGGLNMLALSADSAPGEGWGVSSRVQSVALRLWGTLAALAALAGLFLPEFFDWP